MEKQIKQVASCLQWIYAAFWLLPVLLVLIGENGGDWVGCYVDDVRAAYLGETVTILLTALCVPVSLKLFSWMLAKQVNQVSIAKAIRFYLCWSGIRLALLALPLVAGLLIYYTMLSGKGVLCACIALTASLFCLPSEERLRRELHIQKEESAE